MKAYRYRLRPGYGSQDLLLEFSPDVADETFMNDLFNVLSVINTRVADIEDLWKYPPISPGTFLH